MALLPGGKPFVASEAPEPGYKLVSPGNYAVIITDSEIVQTKAKDGSYLKLTFRVIEDENGDTEFANKKVWHNLNLENKNEVAVEIAQGQLRQICEAVGVAGITDSQELHGIPMLAKIDIRKGNDGFQDQNTISKWYSVEGDTLALSDEDMF